MENAEVFVCDEKCVINHQLSDKSKAWKVVLAVIVVIIILTVLGVIICLARKKMKSSKEVVDVVTTNFPLGDTSRIRRQANKYDTRLVDFASPYEQMFRDIDDRLKIDASCLQFEAEIGRGLTMNRFDHPHLMQLVGLALTDGDVPILVADFMENGDLRTYLRDDSKQFCFESETKPLLVTGTDVHYHNLAKLDADLNIKIGDFGLCRRVSDEDEAYVPSQKHRDVPFPWMAPETIISEKFTFQNDVWAYGVVLWELTTRGLTPYSGKKSFEILEFLRTEKRLEMPEYCPAQLMGKK
ncbi:hypothetical protein TELCIR_15231 [Teladorsagia circumcincta]|uniref:Protein kinase domain-containing protein n=1 Tax=Teladorsagia circumcincta TaxID=45464 RepID=A0A2G9TYW6_TELCI|nr:hypothetical protein TELCIR_15231 [Teladorsagia circumcincta]